VSQANDRIVTREFTGKFDLFALVSSNTARYPFLLESTARQETARKQTARYDILFCFPQQTLRKTFNAELELDATPISARGFLPALDQMWREQRREPSPSGLPFSGGWFLYLGYELVAEIEPGLDLPAGDSRLPIAQATRIPAAIIYDHVADTTSIVAEAAYAELLEVIAGDLHRSSAMPGNDVAVDWPLLQEDPAQRYLDGTQTVLDYIRDGDVFQVNLSRQWQAEPVPPASCYSFYRRLRLSNPAPFAGFAALGEGTIISSSPERLVCSHGSEIETRPIAGTRPRRAAAQADLSIRDELLAHPKERAEHVMLIDLERNDLGRLCEAGSVRVDEMMTLESYAHVHHIVSNVRGRLRPGITPGQIIAAVFPGGTITGCPKVRCMEIIAELEQTARGPYTGSFGYLSHNGDMDLNILIRTISMEQNWLRFRTGAGLVADSVAEQELAETRAKARGLILALANTTEQVGARQLG